MRQEPPAARRRRLLLVEDDRTTYTALQAIFQRRGWEVVVATSMAEAMRALEEGLPDAIVLDLMLPDGSGEAVLERVRQLNLPTRVVVTTGCYDPATLNAVEAMRPAALLHKPIDLGELCRSLGA